MLDRDQVADGAKNGHALAPSVVYWEVTRVCDLACRHCRLAAVTSRHLDELSTEEGFRLIEALAAGAPPQPQLALAGGDPLQRPDLYGLVARADELGLPVEIVLCATPHLTREALAHLRARGARAVRLRLDGSLPTRHDAIRLVQGSFQRTAAAAQWARELGFSLQIDTLACEETLEDLPDIYQRALDLQADGWCVRFPTGVRAGRNGLGAPPVAALCALDGYRCEAVLEWLWDLALKSPRPAIEVADAPHIGRVARQRSRSAAQAPAAGRRTWPAWHVFPLRWRRSRREAPPIMAAGGRGVALHDGAGTMFVSHTGDVYPSESLPLSAGNVRTHDPLWLYREAPPFGQLRDAAQLQGKCGACEFRTVCGGSRARAWAATGDPLAQDPLCVYQPRGYLPDW